MSNSEPVKQKPSAVDTNSEDKCNFDATQYAHKGLENPFYFTLNSAPLPIKLSRRHYQE